MGFVVRLNKSHSHPAALFSNEIRAIIQHTQARAKIYKIYTKQLERGFGFSSEVSQRDFFI